MREDNMSFRVENYENKNAAAATAHLQRCPGPSPATAVIDVRPNDQAALFTNLPALVPGTIGIEVQIRP
jgi:hypothetical protein